MRSAKASAKIASSSVLENITRTSSADIGGSSSSASDISAGVRDADETGVAKADAIGSGLGPVGVGGGGWKSGGCPKASGM